MLGQGLDLRRVKRVVSLARNARYYKYFVYLAECAFDVLFPPSFRPLADNCDELPQMLEQYIEWVVHFDTLQPFMVWIDHLTVNGKVNERQDLQATGLGLVGV